MSEITNPIVIKEIWITNNEEQSNSTGEIQSSYFATYEFDYNEIKEAFNNSRPIFWKMIDNDGICQYFPEQIFIDKTTGAIEVQKNSSQTYFLYPDNTINVHIGC